MPDTAPSEILPSRLVALWRGEIPLPEAFWWYGMALGFFANFFSTFAALALIATDAPAWVALVVNFLPIPYNAVILVGVWRSAAAWEDRIWADRARVAVAVFFAVAIVL